MKLRIALVAFALIAAGPAGHALAASQGRGYMLRDTTSLPPPATSKARLVVGRDMRITQDLKPEFVFVDRTPVGLLPQRTAVTAEVEAGWHCVWLGRGSNVQVWMEFVPGGRYLLRLRETYSESAWRGDLVRESADGYKEFALGKGMKLAVMDERGQGALERHLGRPSNSTAKKDSIAHQRAIGLAKLPIEVAEAWYLPIPSEAVPGDYENKPGKLMLDETSLRFTRDGAIVLEIPRGDVTDVWFGSERGNQVNPWIKVSYRRDGTEAGVMFADAQLETSTENYNRIFAELAKAIAIR